MEWYLNCIKNNYANFYGRARRKEYWMFTLFNIIVLAVLIIIAGILSSVSETLGSIIGIVYFVYSFAVIVPSIAVAVRRLHDTGKSGWWFLIIFIPFGSIVLLVFMCMDSMPMDNQYGSNPKNFS